MMHARLVLVALAVLLVAMVAVTFVDVRAAAEQTACTQPGTPLAGAQECRP